MNYKKSTVEAKLNETMVSVHDAIASGKFKFRWVGMPSNIVTKKPYRGMNAFYLFVLSYLHPDEYQSKLWMTFNQGKERGLKLKKGSKGAPIFYSEKREKKELNDKGEKDYYWFRQFYYVYNESQFEGYQHQVEQDDTSTLDFNEKLDILKSLMEITNVKLINDTDDSAYYSPDKHTINMPKLSVFLGSQVKKETMYLCTLAHEIIHSTALATRPEITRSANVKGADEHIRYAKEEVIAELGSALLASIIGIEKLPLSDHGGYIRGWLSEAVKSDPYWLSKASSYALDAVSHLMKLHDPENWSDIELNFKTSNSQKEAA